MCQSYKELHTTEIEEGDIYAGLGKGRKIIHVEKDDRPFLVNSDSCDITTSVDLFKYLFKREISEILYNEFLVELKNNSKWFKKGRYKLYDANESDAKNVKLEVDNYWLTRLEGYRFIRWFNKNSNLR